MKIVKIIIQAFLLLMLVGCGGKNAKLITFNIGTLHGVDTGRAYKAVVMPFTGTRLILNTDLILYSGDIANIHVAEQTINSGQKIEGFYFILNERGTRKLTNATASNMGSYIVCSYNDTPIGLRIVDSVITDGRLFVCSEFFDSKKSMHDLVEEMLEELGKVNEMKKDL